MVGRIAVLSLLAAAALAQPFATNADERLAGYIEEALNRHPAIHESLAAYRSSLQRIPQITALPEPQFGVTQYLRSPETRVGPQTTTLSISQRLPWFGKLSEQSAARTISTLASAMNSAKRLQPVWLLPIYQTNPPYDGRLFPDSEHGHPPLRHMRPLE